MQALTLNKEEILKDFNSLLKGRFADELKDLILFGSQATEGHLSAELLNKLKLIKDHRNYIAHGKRDTAPPAIELKLSEMAKVLDDVIKEIES